MAPRSSRLGTDAPAAAVVPDAPPAPPLVPAWRLLAVLGGGGAAAGLVLVLAYRATLPRIEAHKAEVLRASVEEVLGAPAKWETLWLRSDAVTRRETLTRDAPAGPDAAKAERVYVGWKADGTRAGFAIVAAEPGFADDVKLIFGYDPATSRVLGFKVLSQKETPGLGDAIEKKASFTGQFAGKTLPLVGVKPGQSRGNPQSEVETITGATISSVAVVRILDRAAERWTPLLRAWSEEEGKR